MEKTYPLIIVFYLDGEMMKQKEIITPFVEAVNNMLHQKNANALAFFLPTSGEERIECINPVIIKEADMEKINAIVEDIKTNFSVAAEMELPIEEVTTDTEIKEEHND
jgi:hypothetical protein